MSFVLELHLY